jgi:tetrahydromethanopterin S-methyltransferase subunit G
MVGNMINTKDLDFMAEKTIEERVKKYRQKLLQKQQNIQDARKKTIQEALDAKDMAEKEFPSVLEEVERKIEAANNRNSRKIEFRVNRDISGMFTLSMLFQLLTLNGFSCSQSYYGYVLEIKW